LGLTESTHDEWLREQGLGEQASAVYLKREIAARLQARMKEMDLDAYRLSERMQTSVADVLRLLDPDLDMITLRTLYRASQALGCRLKVDLC